MASEGSGASSVEAVYSSVEAVPVPDGVSAGQEFTALVWGRRGGQRAAVRKHLWRASGLAPIVVQPSFSTGQGARHQYRPSTVARRATGSTSAVAIDRITTEPASVTQWVSADDMPPELNAADVGWLPGPVGGVVGRTLPAFTGRPMGPRDSALSSSSTARQIMRSVQFSRTYREKVVHCTRQHVEHWQSTRNHLDGTERAFKVEHFKGEHVELWFAVSLRVAKLNPAIPASRLWEPKHHCYDADVDRACSFIHWRWLNRHISFGDYRREEVADERSDGEASDGESSDGESSDDDDAAPAAFDRNRTRRAVSDIARGQSAKAWWPGQHVGFDDCVRKSRHGDGRRIRHKAAVHTGLVCDALNCAHSKYFLNWEEQGWVRDAANSDGAASAAAASGTADGGNTEEGGGSRGGGRAAGQQGGTGGSRGRGQGGGRGSRGGRGRGRGRSSGGGRRGGCAGVAGSADNGQATADAATDNVDPDSECSEGDADDSPAQGVNSVQARLLRACSVLQPHVGHCLWLDRGMSNVSAMQAVKTAGFDVTGIMQVNRIGLPRRYLSMLKKSMTCPKGCKHTTASTACKRWSWTVLHKGDWELEIWSDGAALVVALSSCTSATQCIRLGRSVGRSMRLAVCPMGIGMYNIFGRGPTDGGDQHRQRLSLATRRRTRQGPKAALFDAELGFVNGMIETGPLRSAPQITIWDFADEYSMDVLPHVTMRVGTPAAAAAAAEQMASGTRGQQCAHTPINFSLNSAKQKRACKRSGGTSAPSVTAKRGKKCCEAKFGTCDPDEPMRPHVFCPGCKREREDCTGWYHEACYWKRHRAVLSG